MFLTPSLVLFLVSILVSVILVASSSSLILFWVGLELNTLAFVPLLLVEKNKISNESSIKYFLTQTLASLIFISGIMSNMFMCSEMLVSIILLIALAVKLGAAPFHSWLPSVSKSCNWFTLFILLTVQKINPLLVLWGLDLNNLLYDFIIMMSLVVGGLMGLIQTDIRMLLAYSSINHVGWLLMGMLFSLYVSYTYFLIYMVVLFPIIMLFASTNVKYRNFNLHREGFSLGDLCVLYCLLFSLGGLPPFLGFLSKWLILQTAISGGYYVLSFLMIMMSLFTLFYYIRLGISMFMLSMTKSNLLTLFNSKMDNILILFSSFSFLGLPMVFFI